MLVRRASLSVELMTCGVRRTVDPMRWRARWMSDSVMVSLTSHQFNVSDCYDSGMKRDFASIEYAGNDYFVATAPSGHSMVLDVNHERDTASGPFELVQLAVGGCTGADVISILHKKRQKVTSYRVEVRATRRQEHPRTYEHIEVRHIVHGDGVEEAAIAHAVQLSTEKYCGVINSLRPTATIVATWEIHQQEQQ